MAKIYDLIIVGAGPTDYLYSLFSRPLPGTLDPTTAGQEIQAYMSNLMPTIAADRPELLSKLQGFQSRSNVERYAERQKGGFPNK